MLLIFMMGLLIIIISAVVMSIASIISKKTFSDREKNSPFECGFDPKSSARLPFSLQFFLIAIIFLIFDVEIALILPIIMILKFSNVIMWLSTSVIFIIILLMGLFHEWSQGALNWSF
uniref:NADH-ubiquinone oxidoreductase chain 3 n=1 Tax=Argyra pingwuensis TaxID=2762466 RepID=A0A7G6KSC6_9MUSC|nr:NADH dehydrogenase subunit 3 [Argyra pingwuensis]QNC71308.1 NADH dehydrogenase subunit 3 [Argyra pingwuensis]